MNKEVKKAGSHKIRPSVVEEAKKHVKNDEEVGSFNDLLEILLIEYNKKRRKVPVENEKQGRLEV